MNLVYSFISKQLLVVMFLLLSIGSFSQFEQVKVSKNPKTYCNPLNISYRFSIPNPGCREAADPVLQV